MSIFVGPAPPFAMVFPYLPLFFHILPHTARVLHMVSVAVVVLGDRIPYQNLVVSLAVRMPISYREDSPGSTAPGLSEPIDKWFVWAYYQQSRLSRLIRGFVLI
jgi:hypothetical protein